MAGSTPLFSIVMPTRNRASLLRYALQSALAQPFDDYEVVVSNNHSDDDTEQVVREFSDNRVRYFHTDKVLSMPDSWEFALGKARGEYLFYLCDDDAASSSLLTSIANIIKTHQPYVVSWSNAVYYHSSFDNSSVRNLLAIPQFTGHLRELDAALGLEQLFRLQWKTEFPKTLNSFCHRDVIQSVIRKVGRFFLPQAPDYSSCAFMLGSVRSYFYLNIPLVILGHARESTGRSAESYLAYVQELQDQASLSYVPLRHMMTPTNSVAESLLRVKHALPEKYSNLQVDLTSFFVKHYEDLVILKQFGLEISSSLNEFFDVLTEQPKIVQKRVHKFLRSKHGVINGLRSSFRKASGTTRDILRGLIRCSPRLTRLENSIRGRIFEGVVLKVSNIFDGVQYLDGVLARTSALCK